MNNHAELLGCDELGTESMFGTQSNDVTGAKQSDAGASRKNAKKAKANPVGVSGRGATA